MELSIVDEWLKANRLTLNTKKTKYVVFGTRHTLEHEVPDLNITIGNERIKRVSNLKYLGMVLDDKLTFDEHVNQTYTKASQKLGILHRSQEEYIPATPGLLQQSIHVYHCTESKQTAVNPK